MLCLSNSLSFPPNVKMKFVFFTVLMSECEKSYSELTHLNRTIQDYTKLDFLHKIKKIYIVQPWWLGSFGAMDSH